MTVSNYRSGFAGGVALRNKPIYEPTPRAVWYVDSNAGKDDNSGAFNRPFATLAQAVAKASVGDTIVLAPNHSEDVTSAGGVTVDQNGINIIGLGNGVNRPIFNFSTSTAATFLVSAANCYFENIRFRNQGIDALVTMISVTGANNTFNACETIVNSASYYTVDVFTIGNAADGFKCYEHVHQGRTGKTGGASIFTIGSADDVTIQPRAIVADCSTALIDNTAAAANLRVYGSADSPGYLYTLNSADVVVTCHSSTTGHIGPFLYARLTDDAANITESFVMAAGVFFDPIMVVNAAGQRGLQFNATASADS